MSNLLTFDFKAYSRKKRRRHVRFSIEEAINYATATNLIRPFCSALLLATKKGEKRPEGERRSDGAVCPAVSTHPLLLFELKAVGHSILFRRSKGGKALVSLAQLFQRFEEETKGSISPNFVRRVKMR